MNETTAAAPPPVLRLALLVLPLMLLGACTGGGAAPPPAPPPASNYVLLLDRSDGPQDKAGAGCEMLRKIATAVTTKVWNRNDGRSVVQAYASGTREMIGTVLLLEPTRRGDLPAALKEASIEYSPARRAEDEAKVNAEKARVEQAWRTLPDRIVEACKAKAGPVAFSPLFATLRSGLGECAKAKDRSCQIFFVTDLQETAEPGICLAIRGKASACGSKADKPSLPAPLDAQGATIRICGLTQSRDARGAVSNTTVDRIKKLWGQLIVNAKVLRMDDTCEGLPVD